jgi:glycosyltransferase involved in cell wall biosynthesis
VRLVYVCADQGIPVLGGKGASVHVRSITSALARCGHHVTLACKTLGSGNPAPANVRIVELPSDRSDASDPSDPSEQKAMLVEVMTSAQADGVIERYSLASGPARQASAGLGLPLILEVNAPLVLEAARHRGLSDVDAWLGREQAILSSADAIGVVSTALVDYVHDTLDAPVPCQWIPNGVDAIPFRTARPAALGVPDHCLIVGFTGSMKRWHGVADLIEAARRLGPNAPLHLVIAGHGPESDDIARRVRSAAMEDRVHLLGQLSHDEVPSLLRSVHVGAAPYTPAPDFYFSPLKVLEYLAAELPIICPTIGDLPTLVGDAGIYYDPGDIDGLTGALYSLMKRPWQRLAAAEAAHGLAGRWSWDANASAYEQLVSSARQGLVGTGSGRP